MPEICGLDVMRRLKANQLTLRMLVYSGSTCADTIREALNCQPEAFVQKSDTLEMLLDAIKAVLAGSRYFTPLAASLLYESRVRHYVAVELTGRAREVLQMVAQGLSRKEIANRLEVAVKTVENHRQNLMDKLHIHGIAGLTRYAIQKAVLN
jgi:DNA-binding NarL/FixJ family response regulator